MTNRSITAALLAISLAVVALWAATPASAATAPNGLIAYAAWDAEGTGHDVWLTDPANAGAAPVRLTADGQYNNNPDWSPDGARIAYDGWGQGGGPRIWVMDADPGTNDWAALSTPSCTETDGCFWDFQPAWSPDGAKIAFTSNRSPGGWGKGGYELFVMSSAGEAAGGPATQLTDTPSSDPFGNNPATDWYASWSPDSSRIVFASSRDEGRLYDQCDLYVMDARDANGDRQGDNLRRVTFDSHGQQGGVSCELLQPAWSPVPGSSLVAFASTRSGYFDIHVVDVDNPTDVRNVTQSSTEYDDTPSWSPDGTQIVYRSSRSGAYELWSLPVPDAAPAGSGGGARSVAEAGSATAAPAPTKLTNNGGAENSPKDEQAADWGARSGGGGGGSHMLSVRKAGTGNGRVTSSPAGITCGTDCSQAYAAGTKVTLTAAQASGSTFGGWSGATGCSTATTCAVTMDAAKTVTATFTKAATGGSHTLTVTKKGSGRVTSSPAGITCGTDCTQAYASGTVVTLTAAPARGYALSGWSGACTGTASTCKVTMNSARSVTATFVRIA